MCNICECIWKGNFVITKFISLCVESIFAVFIAISSVHFFDRNKIHICMDRCTIKLSNNFSCNFEVFWLRQFFKYNI